MDMLLIDYVYVLTGNQSSLAYLFKQFQCINYLIVIKNHSRGRRKYGNIYYKLQNITSNWKIEMSVNCPFNYDIYYFQRVIIKLHLNNFRCFSEKYWKMIAEKLFTQQIKLFAKFLSMSRILVVTATFKWNNIPPRKKHKYLLVYHNFLIQPIFALSCLLQMLWNPVNIL